MDTGTVALAPHGSVAPATEPCGATGERRAGLERTGPLRGLDVGYAIWQVWEGLPLSASRKQTARNQWHIAGRSPC